MTERLHVRIKPDTIDGVAVYRLTPEGVPSSNARRLLVHVHGGCYVLNPHEAALPEAVMMAGFSHMKVISVDCWIPAAAYFPAALEDAMAVYRAAVKMILRAKQEGLPMPGVTAPGTPMADVTRHGDSFQTNALVYNVLVSPDGFCDAATQSYAKGHDLVEQKFSSMPSVSILPLVARCSEARKRMPSRPSRLRSKKV